MAHNNSFQDYQEPQIRAVTFDEFESIMKRRNGGGNEPPEKKGSLAEQATEYVRCGKFQLGRAINEIESKSQLSNFFNQDAGMTFADQMKIKVAKYARSFANAANPVVAAPVIFAAKHAIA